MKAFKPLLYMTNTQILSTWIGMCMQIQVQPFEACQVPVFQLLCASVVFSPL